MDTTTNEPIIHYRDPVTGKFLCGRDTGLSLEPLRTIDDVTCPECKPLIPLATPEQIEAAFTNTLDKMMAEVV